MKKEIENKKEYYKNWFEKPFSKEEINILEENYKNLLPSLMTINITSQIQQFILLLPKNLIETNKLFIGEAFEYEKCKKDFEETIEDLKRYNIPKFTYALLKASPYNDESFQKFVYLVDVELKELLENITEENIYGVAKNVKCLRSLTGIIFLFIQCSRPFFVDNDFLEIYSYFELTGKMYGEQASKLENILYPDEN